MLAAVGISVVIAHARLFYRSYFFDDSFISLRYAARFVDGHGLTFNDGERVEGYSNFLWIVLVALLRALTHADFVLVARILGTASTAAAFLGALATAEIRRFRQAIAALLLVLALAASGPVAAWSVAGLESPLLAALVVWGVVESYPLLIAERATWSGVVAPGLLFGLAALTRPDGILFSAGAALGLLVARGHGRRGVDFALRLVSLPLGAVLLHTAFRLAYYGDWVPNTYYAKLGVSGFRLLPGLRYVLWPPAPLWLYALVPIAALAATHDPARRRRIAFVAPSIALWTAYLVFLGGDIAPERRHLVPAFFLLFVVGLEGVLWLSERPRGAVTSSAAAALALGAAAGLEVFDLDRAFAAFFENDSGRAVGKFLGRAFGRQKALIAVDASGAVPFYSGLPTLDMLGLNDRYLATHRPPSFGHGLIAHELGDGAYYLRRQPDLVLFHLPPGQATPIWRGGREMVGTAEFRDLYRVVAFDTGERGIPPAIVWVRAERGRIGIRRTADRIVVPCFLLSRQGGPVTRFDGTGKLGTRLDDGEAATTWLQMDAGSYELDVDTREEVAVSIRVAEGDATYPSLPPVPFTVDGPGAEPVTLMVTAYGAPAIVRDITLTRAKR